MSVAMHLSEDLDGEINQDGLLYDPDKINIATREPTIEHLPIDYIDWQT
jgi:hypothetical protein